MSSIKNRQLSEAMNIALKEKTSTTLFPLIKYKHLSFFNQCDKKQGKGKNNINEDSFPERKQKHWNIFWKWKPII